MYRVYTTCTVERGQITIQCKSYSAQLRGKNIYVFPSSLSLSLYICMYRTMSAVEDEDQFTEFAVDGKREVVHSLLQSAQGPKHTQN